MRDRMLPGDYIASGESRFQLFPMSYETINLRLLYLLPRSELPERFSVSGEPGWEYHLDPPGYPSYFTYRVYDRYQNKPKNGPTIVIPHPGDHHLNVSYAFRKRYGIEEWERKNITWFHMETVEQPDIFQKRLKNIWLPLPPGHERVVLWMKAVYTVYQHEYQIPVGNGEKRQSYIWVHPQCDNYLLVEERLRKRMNGALEAWEEGIPRSYLTPENHKAVRHIQKFYPEHRPVEEWIHNPPVERHKLRNRWWQRCTRDDFARLEKEDWRLQYYASE